MDDIANLFGLRPIDNVIVNLFVFGSPSPTATPPHTLCSSFSELDGHDESIRLEPDVF